MSLHGPIKVDRETIGGWSATRQQPEVVDPDSVNTYAYEAWVGTEVRVSGVLSHRHGDGALVLMSKILLAAAGG